MVTSKFKSVSIMLLSSAFLIGRSNLAMQAIGNKKGELTSVTSRNALFLEAVEKDDLSLVKDLFTQGIDRACRKNGFAAVHVAAHNKSQPMISLLVDDLGFDINCQYECGSTILDHSAQENDLEMVRFLVGKMGSVVSVDNYGSTSLHRAASAGNVEMLELLISKIKQNVKRELNRVDTFGLTPFLHAVEHNAIDAVKCLKKYGVRTDVCFQGGATALHIAAMKNYRNMMQYLLDEENMDPEKENEFGSSCLATAILYDSVDVVDELISRPIKRTLYIGDFTYPSIHYAALVNACKVMKFFLGKEIYTGNERMQCNSHAHFLTPNDLAVMNSNWIICRMLQKRGVDTTSHQRLMGCVVEKKIVK